MMTPDAQILGIPEIPGMSSRLTISLQKSFEQWALARLQTLTVKDSRQGRHRGFQGGQKEAKESPRAPQRGLDEVHGTQKRVQKNVTLHVIISSGG